MGKQSNDQGQEYCVQLGMQWEKERTETAAFKRTRDSAKAVIRVEWPFLLQEIAD